MKTIALLTFLVTASAVSARAQDVSHVPPPPAPVVEATAKGTPPVRIEDDELAELKGREGAGSTVLSDQDLTAVNRGNTITATTVGSGPITLGAGAFDGFAGVGNFVINSGHNNNLQGALTINIISPQ